MPLPLTCVVFALAFAAHFTALRTEASDRAYERNTIAIFDMRDCGDFWCVPVTIGDATYRFAVDTGVGRPIFDTSLRTLLGDAVVASEIFRTSTGPVEGQLFSPPKALVGALPIDPATPVGCFDLGHVKDLAAADIAGLLGPTFLRQYVVQFDFDLACLRILRSVPHDAGRELPLEGGDDPRPYCRCKIDENREELFLLDTGAVSRSSVSIQANVFDDLANTALKSRDAPLALSQPRVFCSALGTRMVRKSGQLRRLNVAGFEEEYVDVHAASTSKLGLKFLSQYVVTIDFPQKRICLRPIPGAENDEHQSGIFLRRCGERTIVETVSEDGPGARSGLLRGDQVLAIDGVDARSTHIFALRRLLVQSGDSMEITIKRGDTEMMLLVEQAPRTSNKR